MMSFRSSAVVCFLVVYGGAGCGDDTGGGGGATSGSGGSDGSGGAAGTGGSPSTSSAASTADGAGGGATASASEASTSTGASDPCVRAPERDAECAEIVNFGKVYDEAWQCESGEPDCDWFGIGDGAFCCEVE